MKRLVLVDGNALLHRAYHATPPLTTSKGELVNAVYGFTAMMLRSIQDLKPDFITIAWDEKGPTFRHQQYTQYKATRGPTDEGLSSQYTRVFEVTKALNIPEFRLSGFEADDLIGTIAKQAIEKEKNLEVIILTGDRDIMQIIGPRVKVLMPKKTLLDVGLYGEAEFIERFGFEPKLMVDYKALRGDASDNIPGVPGIGDVTATKLIKEFGTMENVYKPEHLKTLPARTQTLLAEGAESAVMSKQLATLDCDSPIEFDLAACQTGRFNRDGVLALLEELEFKTLIAKLPGNSLVEEKTSSQNADTARSQTKIDQSISTETASFETGQPSEITKLDLDTDVVLKKMTETGVMIDLDCLSKLGTKLKDRLAFLESEIYSTVGHEFNLNSPKQLSEVLFDELHLPVIKKTKTGRSTDEGTLQELSDAHPAIKLLLEYRQLFKLISTYIDALPKYVGLDGRVHSTFNVEGAATGRLSSNNPNLQNIPIKGDLGTEVRKAFVVSKGKVLLGADYSQIELRIMAHLANDPGLKSAFLNNIDIHSLTAAKIFDTDVSKIDRQQRMVGKTMNFATLYGQGPRALSKQLGVDSNTAKKYIEDYFQQFPKVKEWMHQTVSKAYQDGYVETLWGRKRYIPELNVGNPALRAFGERAAINHPVQGSSADMIKKAMVEIDKRLDAKQCQLILQIHDELLFECSEDYLNQAAKIIRAEMEKSLKLSVPVIADLKAGPNWGEMKPIGS